MRSFVGGVEAQNGAVSGVVGAAEVGIGTGKRRVPAEPPFDVGGKPEVAWTIRGVPDGKFPDLNRLIGSQENATFRGDPIPLHDERRIAEAYVGGEAGAGCVDRKEAGVPEGAGFGVAQVEIASSIPDQADAALRMVEREGLVVEHTVPSAELIEPGNQGVIPEEIDLRPWGGKGVGNDKFTAIRREMSIGFHSGEDA